MTNTRSRKRRWVQTLSSIGAFAVAGATALFLVGVYALVSHVDIADATPASAETSFEAARERFAGTDPLVRLTRQNGVVRGNVVAREHPSQVRPDALYLMTWSSHDERLVRLRLPLWLWRIVDDGSMGDIVGDLDLRAADIDHHGPGLVLDQHEPGRQRLMWAE